MPSTGGVRIVPGNGIPGVSKQGAEAVERPLLLGRGVSARGRDAVPPTRGREEGLPPQVGLVFGFDLLSVRQSHDRFDSTHFRIVPGAADSGAVAHC